MKADDALMYAMTKELTVKLVFNLKEYYKDQLAMLDVEYLHI